MANGGCAGCATKTAVDGTPMGCRSKGNCSTGGCNKMNTFDWLARREVEDVHPFHIVEVSFRNGTHKDFFFNQPHLEALTGDQVVVDMGKGYDIGRISLSGELVRLQMRKKKVRSNSNLRKIIRRANERDLERLEEARSRERSALVLSRSIAYQLNSTMKISDVEFQADNRKATFYYTSEERVDFRKIVKEFAQEFRVKIEMRQIGARQESGLVGGIGSCGRELCCSTWLTDFKSVSTAAARYQNLAINQSKLSGQCGRLKCCLNYELDTYMKAIKRFPRNVDKLRTEAGTALLIKTDIFKGLMYYSYARKENISGLFALEPERAREIKEMNKRGEKPMDLRSFAYVPEVVPTPAGVNDDDYDPDDVEFAEDLTGVIDLPPEERRKRRRNRNRSKKKPGGGQKSGGAATTTGKTTDGKSEAPKKPGRPSRNRNRNRGGQKPPTGDAPRTDAPKQDGGAPGGGDNKAGGTDGGGGNRSGRRRGGRGRRNRGPKKE